MYLKTQQTTSLIVNTFFLFFPLVAFDYPTQVDPTYSVRYYWKKTDQQGAPIDLFIQARNLLIYHVVLIRIP